MPDIFWVDLFCFKGIATGILSRRSHTVTYLNFTCAASIVSGVVNTVAYITRNTVIGFAS